MHYQQAMQLVLAAIGHPLVEVEVGALTIGGGRNPAQCLGDAEDLLKRPSIPSAVYKNGTVKRPLQSGQHIARCHLAMRSWKYASLNYKKALSACSAGHKNLYQMQKELLL